MADGNSVGFVGLGTMGGAMAGRLLEAGRTVVAFDPNPKALGALEAQGAKAAGSLAEVAERAEIIFMSLPTPPVVKTVAIGDGGLNSGRARILVDLSTTGPRVSGEVAKALAASGRTLVDAPVSGGRAGALKGALSVMAACPAEAWREVEPHLATFGKTFHVGAEAGQAQTLKLINNLLSVVALVATSEGMAMGVKAGLDAKVMIDVLNASSGRNSATQDKFPRAVLTGTFDFGFPTELSRKDVRLCLEEAEAMGVPMPMGQTARTMLGITQSLFGPDADFTHIARVLEQWTGVEIRATSDKREAQA